MTDALRKALETAISVAGPFGSSDPPQAKPVSPPSTGTRETGMGRGTEQLIHYSAKPLTRLRSVRQDVQPDSKPRGLWFSVEQPWVKDRMGWREWCEAESFALNNFKASTELKMTPTARIVRLASAKDIDRFHAKYRAELIADYWLIDWRNVASDFDAIIIAPYIWERRFGEPRWYYSWDCASGCVWNAYAVQDIRPPELANPPPQEPER